MFKLAVMDFSKSCFLLRPYYFSFHFTAMMMMLAQQLSGINAAIFYSTSIFESAGLSESDAQSATLGMGAMNVAMTFVSLVLIEKAGRKTLMLVGLSVMVVCTTMLLICLALAVSLSQCAQSILNEIAKAINKTFAALKCMP